MPSDDPHPWIAAARLTRHGNGGANANGATRSLRRKAQIAERDQWVCQLCLQDVDQRLRAPHPWSATVDHVIPKSEGGTMRLDNLQLAHRVCNQQRHNGPKAT